MVAFNERRQFFARLQLVGSDHNDLRFTLSEKLRQLENAHAQERIQEQWQHRDHEQRPPIAKLIANLAGVDQTYVAPRHGLRKLAERLKSVKVRCSHAEAQRSRSLGSLFLLPYNTLRSLRLCERLL